MFNSSSVLVILDDGHGKETAGKRTPKFADGRQIREWEFNSEVTLELGRQLKQKGYNVEYTKNLLTMYEDISINSRCNVANKYYDLYTSKGFSHENIIFISSHYNAYTSIWDSCKGGTETLYYKFADKETIRLAQTIQNSLVDSIELIDRGIKARDDLGVLKGTKCKACLIEYGFMDVRREALLMLDTQHIKKCASGVVNGIERYFGGEEVDMDNTEDKLNNQQDVSAWARKSWDWCKDMGFLDGTRPQDTVTREELATVILRVYEDLYRGK